MTRCTPRRPARTRRFGQVVLIAALAMLAACGSPDQKAAKAIARFEVYYAQRDMFHARIEINRALAIRDDIAEYWNKLGRVELADSRYLPAYSAYTRALELEADNSEAIQAVAELSYSGGKPDDAMKYADKMLAREPRNLRMLFVKGSVDYDRASYAEAHRIADIMLFVDPRNEGGAVLMARTRFAMGETAPAVAQIRQSIDRDGETVPKLAALLDFYRSLNDLQGVDGTYRRLAFHDPQSIPLGIDHARELYEFDRADMGLAVIDALLRAHPDDDDCQKQVIDLWTSLGPDVIGIDQIRHVAATASGRMKVMLAQLVIDQHRYDEAIAMLTPMLGKSDINPDNVQPKILYAAAISGLGRKAEALAQVDRLLAFDKTNPQALLLRVNIESDQGRLANALTDAQLLVRDNPQMAEARIVVARVYTLRKERLLADAALARAADDLADDIVLLRAYTNYLLATDRLAQALDVAKTFTDRNDRVLAGWKLRGELCLQAMDRPCLDTVLGVLPQLRSGAKEKAVLAAAIARKEGKAAAKPSDHRPAAAKSAVSAPPGSTVAVH